MRNYYYSEEALMTFRKIVAVFDTQDAAQNARDSLLELGLQREQINIVDQGSGEFSTRTADGRQAGFWAHVKEMFMPDDDRETLEESVRRGGYLLSASVDDDRVDEAIARLEAHGAVDLDQRQGEWRRAGIREDATPRPTGSPELSSNSTSGQAIPVIEERLRVGKREVNRGGVRVRSYIVEEPVHEEVRLREERVEVERRPVDEPARPVVRGSPEDMMQERTVEVSETAEQAVVGKEARVKEEVRIHKSAEERVEEIDDTLRHTEVEVEDTRTGEVKGRPKPDPRRPNRM
jgi:uncharacterized protein (TIGR02271 family)